MALHDPLLALALKYGAAGPWKHDPWAWFNPSVAFDAYASSRGPHTGLPGLGELAATQMMGLGVNGTDFPRFLRWRRDPDTSHALDALRDALVGHAGLHDLPDEGVRRLASFADSMIGDDVRLPRFRVARVFKWLSAWAPAHVPMIDRAVHAGLTGSYPAQRSFDAWTLLTRYRDVLREHLGCLQEIAAAFHAAQPGLLPSPLSAVRLLDNLYWFDWIGAYDSSFRTFVRPRDEGECHEVLAPGREIAGAAT